MALMQSLACWLMEAHRGPLNFTCMRGERGKLGTGRGQAARQLYIGCEQAAHRLYAGQEQAQNQVETE